MKISVKRHHIQQGRTGDCKFCPIALAMVEAGLEAVNVKSSSAWWVDPVAEANYWAPLPLVAQNFIKDFDAGCHVEPFEFELEGIW